MNCEKVKQTVKEYLIYIPELNESVSVMEALDIITVSWIESGKYSDQTLIDLLECFENCCWEGWVMEKVKQGAILKKHAIHSLEQAELYLTEVILEIEDKALREVALMPLRESAFLKASAARGRHQAHEGGLLLHTAQVVYTTLNIIDTVLFARIEEAIVGCIWHDYGKIYTYVATLDCKYEYTDANSFQGHLSLSNSMFIHRALNAGVEAEKVNFVSHLILAHHGRKEWGSPVEPKCIEAYALHAADMISAQFVEE